METFIRELTFVFKLVTATTIQASILICLIFVLKAILRGRLEARWQYWLWIILLVRMVMPWGPASNFSVFNLLPQADKTVVPEKIAAKVHQSENVISEKASVSESQKIIPASTNAATTISGGRSYWGIWQISAFTWFVIAAGMGGFSIWCNFRLLRIVKSRRPVTEERILNLLEDCKAEMGIKTILGVVITDKVKSPALFGIIRPRLLLPEGMTEKLNTEELRYVFLHELGHLKRHDIYAGWAMVILQVIHWFNPLVWFAFARMRAERELACDSLVLSIMGGDKSQTYGQTLINFLRDYSGTQYAPGIAGILENKTELKRRITMITRFKKGSYRLTAAAGVILVLLGLAVLTDAQERQGHQAKTTATEEKNENKNSGDIQSKPKVVGTYPEALSNDVDPSVDQITVKFNNEMMDQSWSWTGGGDTYPQSGGKPFYDETKTICTLPVKLEAGKVYWVGINSPSYKNFKTPDRIPVDWYIILFSTKNTDGSPTTIPQDLLDRAKAINSRSGKNTGGNARNETTRNENRRDDSVNNDNTRSERTVKLFYDDGKSAGRESIAGSGHAVRFEGPREGCLVTAVRIYGSRYGADQPPQENFHIYVCDANFNAMADFAFPYSRFQKADKNGNPKGWVTFNIEPTEAPSTFYISVDFNPERTKGVYVHHDGQSSGHSFIAIPGQELQAFERGDWMIRATIQKQTSESEDKDSSNAVKKTTGSEGTKSNKMEAENLIGEGWNLWKIREYSTAEEAFKKAVEKDSANDRAYQGLGWAQLNQGKKANARDSFEKCVAINPKNSAALNGLGWIAHGEGDKEKAISWWEKAVEANPAATASLNGLTQAYMEKKDYEKAIKYYKMWLAAEPDNAEAKAGLAKAQDG